MDEVGQNKIVQIREKSKKIILKRQPGRIRRSNLKYDERLKTFRPPETNSNIIWPYWEDTPISKTQAHQTERMWYMKFPNIKFNNKKFEVVQLTNSIVRAQVKHCNVIDELIKENWWTKKKTKETSSKPWMKLIFTIWEWNGATENPKEKMTR